MDRHTDVQRETIIPRHYGVAGYKNFQTFTQVFPYKEANQEVNVGISMQKHGNPKLCSGQKTDAFFIPTTVNLTLIPVYFFTCIFFM